LPRTTGQLTQDVDLLKRQLAELETIVLELRTTVADLKSAHQDRQ
jgi:prefoldin subunit 5